MLAWFRVELLLNMLLFIPELLLDEDSGTLFDILLLGCDEGAPKEKGCVEDANNAFLFPKRPADLFLWSLFEEKNKPPLFWLLFKLKFTGELGPALKLD